MRGQVSAPSSLPRGERGCSSLFPSMAVRFVRAGRTGLRPAGTSGRTVRSGPALDGRGPAGPDRTSGPVRVRPDASGVRSFPNFLLSKQKLFSMSRESESLESFPGSQLLSDVQTFFQYEVTYVFSCP